MHLLSLGYTGAGLQKYECEQSDVLLFCNENNFECFDAVTMIGFISLNYHLMICIDNETYKTLRNNIVIFINTSSTLQLFFTVVLSPTASIKTSYFY